MSMFHIFIITLCLFGTGTRAQEEEPEEDILLAEDDEGSWRIGYNVSVEEKTITFNFTTTLGGWMGVSFNDKEDSMIGADVFMGYLSLTGGREFLDCFVIETDPGGYHTPIIDTMQNWTWVYGRTYWSNVTFLVSREWNTCDLNDTVIPNQPIYVSWVVSNTTDFYNGSHLDSGSLTVNLLEKFLEPGVDPNVPDPCVELPETTTEGVKEPGIPPGGTSTTSSKSGGDPSRKYNNKFNFVAIFTLITTWTIRH